MDSMMPLADVLSDDEFHYLDSVITAALFERDPHTRCEAIEELHEAHRDIRSAFIGDNCIMIAQNTITGPLVSFVRYVTKGERARASRPVIYD